MSPKLDLIEKILCNKIGKMFELASIKLSCSELTFCKAWALSDLNKKVYLLDETFIYQSKNYIFNSFMKENNFTEINDYQMDSSAMYWIGYLLTYWQFLDKIDGEDIIRKYSLKDILEQYDVLHTMSIKAAIKTIKKDYSIKKVLIDQILHAD